MTFVFVRLAEASSYTLWRTLSVDSHPRHPEICSISNAGNTGKYRPGLTFWRGANHGIGCLELLTHPRHRQKTIKRYRRLLLWVLHHVRLRTYVRCMSARDQTFPTPVVPGYLFLLPHSRNLQCIGFHTRKRRAIYGGHAFSSILQQLLAIALGEGQDGVSDGLGDGEGRCAHDQSMGHNSSNTLPCFACHPEGWDDLV